MAYCRYNEGDVYMHRTPERQILCHNCQVYFKHALEAFLHLCDHEEEGDSIPEKAFEKLEKEIISENWTDADDY